MATVHVPSGWTRFTDGLETLTIDAPRVRELFDALAHRFPALGDQLEQMAVAIDGQIFHHARYEPLRADSEVHLLPPVAGGEVDSRQSTVDRVDSL